MALNDLSQYFKHLMVSVAGYCRSKASCNEKAILSFLLTEAWIEVAKHKVIDSNTSRDRSRKVFSHKRSLVW